MEKLSKISDADLLGLMSSLVLTERGSLADVIEHLVEIGLRNLGSKEPEVRRALKALRRTDVAPEPGPLLRAALQRLAPPMRVAGHRTCAAAPDRE